MSTLSAPSTAPIIRAAIATLAVTVLCLLAVLTWLVVTTPGAATVTVPTPVLQSISDAPRYTYDAPPVDSLGVPLVTACGADVDCLQRQGVPA